MPLLRRLRRLDDGSVVWVRSGGMLTVKASRCAEPGCDQGLSNAGCQRMAGHRLSATGTTLGAHGRFGLCEFGYLDSSRCACGNGGKCCRRNCAYSVLQIASSCFGKSHRSFFMDASRRASPGVLGLGNVGGVRSTTGKKENVDHRISGTWGAGVGVLRSGW